MKHLPYLILLAALVVVACGCETMTIYPPTQWNFYRGPNGDVYRIKRVCFVQLAENTGYPDIARRMTQSLKQALQERGMFHVDVVRADHPDLRDLDLTKREPYTIRELAQMRQDLHCDAILFGQITHFQPYPSQQVGLYLRLIDLRDGQLVWAIDDVWDTTQRETVARIRRYFFLNMRSDYEPVGDELAVMSTEAFQKFVSVEVTDTLDPHSNQKTLPRQFFDSPTGIDLRRVGRGTQRVATDIMEDF